MAGVIQSTGLYRAGAVASIQASFAQLPTIGDNIVSLNSVYSNAGTPQQTVTDNQSNVYTKVKEQLAPDSFSACAISSCQVTTSSGTFTITVKLTSTTNNYFAGCSVETPPLYDPATNVTSGGNGTSVTSGTTGNTAVIGYPASISFAVCCFEANNANLGITNPPTGFIAIANENNSQSYMGHESCYQLNYYPANRVASWSSSTANYSGAIVVFKVYNPTLLNLGVGL